MKFIADRMLGKLAKELRMLGYDTAYFRAEKTDSLIKQAREENRMILTRNQNLRPKRPEDRVVQINENKVTLQLKELVQKGIVSLNGEPLFSRCLLCNTPLIVVSKEEAEGKVPDYTLSQQTDFFLCTKCSKFYWQGSHQENMKKRIQELKDQGLENRG